jgi:hypothetical protein
MEGKGSCDHCQEQQCANVGTAKLDEWLAGVVEGED